jgi:nucleoside-diphosphate-sugar epimerase
MRVVVIGATGNVGSSVVEALVEEPAVESIVGIARRRPAWNLPKVEWVEADVIEDDLRPLLDGADVALHLAWAIQPSRDEAMLRAINVQGSGRVFQAVAQAGVPALVYASSVGAYSPGPKDRAVDETWPTGGVHSSFYSRHKAQVELLLDRFESENPDVRVVRLRPGLIFKREAASEIRRLFAGPFLPGFLLRRGLIPVVPRVAGLRFQAVHSRDVAQAYRAAVVGDASGAFNVAADPVIGSTELADLLDARMMPVPARALRALTSASWRLRLQPSPPGWLDMALAVPIMDSGRAREQLGWRPRHSSLDALSDLLAGLRSADGMATPPLDPQAGGPGRAEELKTGIGARQ